MGRNSRSLLVTVLAFVSVSFFQNCSKSTFSSQKNSDSSSSLLSTDSLVSSNDNSEVQTSTPAGKIAPQVCHNSTCAYQSLQAAIDASNDGSTLYVAAEVFPECINIQKNNLKIIGVKGYFHLTNVPCSDSVLTNWGSNNYFENIEISGWNKLNNARAFTHTNTAQNLKIKNMYLHDGKIGIAATSLNDEIIIDNLKTLNVGDLRRDENGTVFEINAPVSILGTTKKLLIRNSIFEKPNVLPTEEDGTSLVKSSALETIIDCSIFGSGDKNTSALADFRDSAVVTVTNSIFQKNLTSPNSVIIRYIGYGPKTDLPAQLTLSNNLFISDRVNTTYISDGNPTIGTRNIRQNTFVGASNIPSSWLNLQNQWFADRSSSGISGGLYSYPLQKRNCQTPAL